MKPLASIALPAALLTTALTLGAAEQRPDPAPPPLVSDVGERCVDCHAALVESYRRSGMANALGTIAPGELSGQTGLAEVADGTTGFHYRFEQEARGARIVETWRPPNGVGPVVTRKAELAFAIGAGFLDRSYVAVVGELMSFAPLEVNHDREKPFAALAPGHAIQPGTRFSTPITEECLACHSDTLPPRDYPSNLLPERSEWKPTGIGCAACHAETDAHVAWRERELAGELPNDRAANDATSGEGTTGVPSSDAAAVKAPRVSEGDPIRTFGGGTDAIASVSACARCHLQGDASFLLEPGARGLAAPGGDMLDRRAVFVAAEPTNDVGFVSHVERLVLSPCFTGSLDQKRTLDCVTCHDPHRSVFEEDERAIVRSRCLECHPAGDAAPRSAVGDGAETSAIAAGLPHEKPCALPLGERGAQDCVQCHMRATEVFDVADVVVHDHWIRTRPGPKSQAGALRVDEALDGKLAVFGWPGRPKPAYAHDPGLWMMAYAGHGRPDLALAQAKKPPGAASERLATYHHLRGSLLERTTRPADALPAYERALALDPEQAETAVNLGALLGRLARPAEGAALLDALIAKHPSAEGALRNRALLAQQRGDLESFARDLEAAHAILPQAPLARALGQYWMQRGRADLAETWMREAKRLDPTLP